MKSKVFDRNGDEVVAGDHVDINGHVLEVHSVDPEANRINIQGDSGRLYPFVPEDCFKVSPS